MTNKLDIYKCSVCGNIVQVLICGEGELHCCGEPMNLMQVNYIESDMGEYHVPVYRENEMEGKFVQVGKELHPMTNEHHIEFMELISNDNKNLQIQYFNVSDEPKMLLEKEHCEYNKALELCNLHGLWGGSNDK